MTHSAIESHRESSSSGSNPLVSVIIPAYNVESYLKDAVDSALSQTLSDLEVIIVDDCSQDGTLQVAQACAASDNRVKVIVSPVNRGAAVARNLALEAATGDWIAILDADDWFSPTRLEVLLSKAEEYSVDMIADDLSYVLNTNPEPWTSFVQQNGELYTKPTEIGALFYVKEDSQLWDKQGVSPGFLKPMMHRSLLEQNRVRYKDYIRLGHDFFFFLECLLADARYLFYPEAHYFYRARPGSLVTKSKRERWLQAEQGLTEILNDPRLLEETALRQALLFKLSVCRKKRQYESVVEPLREKKYIKAVLEMAKNPYFFIRIVQRLQEKISVELGQKSAKMAERPIL